MLDGRDGPLAGRYRIEEEVGWGGMATVYRAHDLKLDRTVALKVLRPEVAASVGTERFLREIRTVARLEHPRILSLYDSGEVDGLLFYAMPFVEGETLRERLERERQLPRDEALEIVRQVGAALGFAHAQGVVHRDIKPENILLSRGDAFLADFGIAHALDAAGGERLTQTGMAVGTPVYMSPEQARGPASLDGRSDQYSLACVLYEMLVGAPPFDGPTAQVIFARHSMDPVPPLRSARSTVPAEVETAVERALAKSPADRFPSVDEFVNALEGAAGPDADRAARPGPARFARWVGLRGISAGAVLAVLVLAGAWGWAKQARAGWARTEALPEAARLIQEGRNHAALRLLREAEAAIPGDPVLQELLLESTSLVTVRTTPPGARVSVRDFLGEPDDWEVLGRAPLDDLRLPTADLVWRIEHEGYATRHAVAFTPARTFHFALQPAADAPAQMVYVPGGPFELYSTGVVELEPYWIDRYEVTNRRFRAFVEGGGYARREHRTEPFVRGGGAPPREEAIDRFRDRTGRPGPATWEVSTYPDGEDDRPVVGVSWYEAAAYCASVGKQLPTVHHWYHAAQLGLTTQYAAVSRFSADGPVDVGRPRAMGRFGTYDMAGNAKEWTWNAADAERRYILGGGWDEPAYQFSNPDAQNPFARRPTYGFRCARYDEPLSPALLEPIAAPFRDYREETPVGDDVFAVYQNLYRYDPTPLEARVESVDDELENWRTERVSFAAAYGEERVPALLLLPTDARPPFQTVVYFPGAGAFFERPPFDITEIDSSWFLFLVRSGRAVLFPVYKGSYERHVGSLTRQDVWQEVMIHAAKDLGRAVDYLETRPDIDTDRLAFFALSSGAGAGPIMTATETRFRASVLVAAGLLPFDLRPESDPFNFLPRVTVPTLMINGRTDFYFPYETSQAPMFRWLGTPPEHKRHSVFESGHVPDERNEVIRETLDWLDRYLGPVERR